MVLSSRREHLIRCRGEVLYQEWWVAGTGCPERLWMPHPWRRSWPGWMGPWATLSSTRSGVWLPCLGQGGWNLMILEVPSNPSHSMILREGEMTLFVPQNNWYSGHFYSPINISLSLSAVQQCNLKTKWGLAWEDYAVSPPLIQRDSSWYSLNHTEVSLMPP